MSVFLRESTTLFGKTKPDGDRIEFGDASHADFKPHVKLTRWAGECHFSMGIATTRKILPVQNGATVRWISPLDGMEVRGYFKDSACDNYEYEIILAQAPVSNTITLDLVANGLDFIYQPELTPVEVARGNIRPANVVGSYAVYHSTKGPLHSIPGDAEKYKTGKAFHIYRPELIDADGDRAWADLDIDVVLGKMIITMPRAWLDAAAYPVIVDPTIGYTSIGGSWDNTNNYLITSARVQAGTTGDANPGTAYVYGKLSASGSRTAMMGVYAGGAVPPDGQSKVSSSDAAIAVNSTTAAWLSAAITWTGITSGTYYYVALNGQGQHVNDPPGTMTAYDASGTTYYAARTHANDMPATFPVTANFTAVFSLYVDYTAAGGTILPMMMQHHGG